MRLILRHQREAVGVHLPVGGDDGISFDDNIYIAKNTDAGGGQIKAGVALKKEAEFGNVTDVIFAIPVKLPTACSNSTCTPPLKGEGQATGAVPI
jgi:hypothetical protein